MTTVDLPLPTLPADPELAVVCHCGAPRSAHAGRKHLGHCRGHDAPHAIPATDPQVIVTIQTTCPDGCRRFWPARGERLRLRALAAFDEDLAVPIAEADKARPRSRKTEDARAAGQFGVGPSDVSGCRKRIEYRERPPEDFVPIEVDRMAAYEGTLLHDGITRARRLRYPWRKFGVVIHVPGLDRAGEGDEVDPVLGVVIDYKCTTLDTLFLMADGTERRADQLRAGDEVVSWHEGALVAARVAWTADNGQQPIYLIRTSGGRRLRVTAEHPVLVGVRRRDRVRYEWRKAHDVRTGDRVVAAFGWRPAASRGPSPDAAWLLGALIGDGTVMHERPRGWDAARFTNDDPAIVAALRAVVGREGGRVRSASRYEYRLLFGDRSAEFRAWLDANGVLGHGAHTKTVPDPVKQGGETAWVHFLSGLLDTDGYVRRAPHAPLVTWVSVSEALLRGCQQLLANLGVQSSLAHCRVGRQGEHWRLTVGHATGVERLAQLLQPRGRKAEALRDAAVRCRVVTRRKSGHAVSGHLVTVTSVEVLKPEPTIAVEIEGTHTHVTDGLVSHNTAGSWKWDTVGDYGPPESEWDQVMTYGLGLEDEGIPVEWVELHYYNREHFRNPERFRRPYSRARALAAVSRLHAILDDLDAGRELPRDEPGPSTSAICRTWCEAVLHCWNVEEAELNRRSPESWMLVHDDKDVEEAIRRYLDAHDTLAKPGDQAKDREKVLLDGIPFGRYGDFTWSEVGGNESWVDDRIARAEQLEAEMRAAADEARPPADPDTLPVPQRLKRTPVQRRPGRVRKAILEKEARAAERAG